jgi:flagellar FliL protein
MKSKLKFIIPALLVVVFGGLKMTVLKAAPVDVKPPNVKGEVYVIPTPFLVNIEGGRFAKVSVGLIFEEGHSAIPHAGVGTEVQAASAAAPPPPPEGYGVLPQEALVRSIITDVLTGVAADKLASSDGREKLAEKIVKRLHKETDTHVHEVFFIDVVVQ